MKTVRIPYSKYKNLIFVKKIDYDLHRHYKKISYLYEVYDEKGELVKELLHRINNPCVVIYSGNYICELQYWNHGNKHREHGPAIMRLDKTHKVLTEEWYINNIKLTETEIDDIKILNERRKKMYKVILKMQNKKKEYINKNNIHK